MNFEQRVAAWADARNLIHGSTPAAQIAKLREEVDELAEAIDSCDEAAMQDAIGDTNIVLAVICAQMTWSLAQCCEGAWEEIKDRKGRMVDGVFVKEASE